MSELTVKKAVVKPTIALPTGKYTYAVGRRKASAAQVRLYKGTGRIVVNGRELSDFLSRADHQQAVRSPFELLAEKESYDVSAKVHGGGITGQAEAIRLGIARALIIIQEELRPSLKKAGYLRRDPRKVERKKYGLKSARRAPQWAKR